MEEAEETEEAEEFEEAEESEDAEETEEVFFVFHGSLLARISAVSRPMWRMPRAKRNRSSGILRARSIEVRAFRIFLHSSRSSTASNRRPSIPTPRP